MTDTLRAGLVIVAGFIVVPIGAIALARLSRWAFANALAATMRNGVRYDGWRRDVIRGYVFDRDHGMCVVCGAEYRTMDCHHKRAVSAGGGYRTGNLETRCRRCHKDAHPWMV